MLPDDLPFGAALLTELVAGYDRPLPGPTKRRQPFFVFGTRRKLIA